LGKRLAVLLLFFGIFSGLLAAQESPDAGDAASFQLRGAVHTGDGDPVPASTVRITETASGKVWLTWTDESGVFEFPALPAGHYRIETSQLGFAPATSEMDLTQTPSSPVEIKLQVGTLSAITSSAAAPPTPTQVPSQMPGAPPQDSSSANAAPPSTTSKENNTASKSAPAIAKNRIPTTGVPGGERQGQGVARRGFQQVGLNGQSAENTGDDTNPSDINGSLGQAASADAIRMSGTVAMGQVADQMGANEGPGGEPGGEMQGTFVGGGPGGIPGQGPSGGGPGGGPGSGPGGFGGGFGGRGGGGRAGPGRGGPGRGGQRGGPVGIEGLMGVERLSRQRINRMHYSFYNSYGNAALNARPYSLNQANPAKISGWSEGAGLNMGGPLKIPHVYDGTDKTFFYINFGGSWSRTPVDSFSTVPTAAERAGDFSADNVQLYNPNSNPTGPRTLMPNSGCSQDAANAPGTCIPQNLISQQSLNLLNYIPLPNLPGQSLNFHLQTNLPGISNRLNVNVTHQISSKLSLQVTYNLSNTTSHSLNSFPGIEGNSYARGQTVMIGLTQNWTKSFVHTSQLYFSRSRTLGLNEFSYLTDISAQLGITGVSPVPFDYGLPSINFTSFTGLSDANPSLARSQNYRYVDSARWIKTKHTITLGGEIRKMDINRDNDPTPNGQFSFTGLLTSQLTAAGTPVQSATNCGAANPAVPCIGNDFADFLLGFPANTKVQFGNTSTYFRNWGYIGYLSDDWHVVPKFTLTFGVRYEAFTPPTEINGHIANLLVSPGFTQVQCVTPRAAGNCIAGQSASLFNGHYNNWAPRFGIAWQPPGKWFSGQHQTTIRAGFGMFYVQSYLNTLAAEMANQPPFAVANTLATLSGANPTLLTLQNGFPSGALPTNALTNTVAVNPDYRIPYAMVWNTSIEYDLFKQTFLELMYTGTRGVHLDELLGYSLVTAGQGNSTNNAAGFSYDTTGAFSNYNALQVRLQKRMSYGLAFMTRYTYAKSLDNASTIGGSGQTVIQNNSDPVGDYGLSSFDIRHQFLGTFTYQLPFGERQRFAAQGWKKSVFGAWRVNANVTAHSGTPFTVRIFSKNQACQNVPGINSERANQDGNPALADPTVQQWFNTSLFNVPTGCFGDAPRNSVIGPGSFTINSGVTKTIQFGRDGLRRLDITWNAYNLLNKVNFTNISTILGSRTFGQVTAAGSMRSMTFTTRVNF
jgi:hypothetical protein